MQYIDLQKYKMYQILSNAAPYGIRPGLLSSGDRGSAEWAPALLTPWALNDFQLQFGSLSSFWSLLLRNFGDYDK